MKLINASKVKQSLIEAGAGISILNALDAAPDAFADLKVGPLTSMPSGVLGVSDEMAWMTFAAACKTSDNGNRPNTCAIFADNMLAEFRRQFPREWANDIR